MEYLDVIDEMGNATGQIIDRESAHKKGILHRTGHVWIFKNTANGPAVLLQKRSADKASYPGLYDISTAGHIPAGSGRIESAVREAAEELGIIIDPSNLLDTGWRKLELHAVFNGKPFFDRQISDVYALEADLTDFVFSDREVEEVRWELFFPCLQKIYEKELPNCIVWQELLYAGLCFLEKRRLLKSRRTINDFMRLLENQSFYTLLSRLKTTGYQCLKEIEDSDTILIFH